MTNNEAKKFVEAVYRDIWSGKDVAKFDKYYHKDLEAIAYLPNEELVWDYTSLKNFAEETAKVRYNVDTNIEDVVAYKAKILVKYSQRSVNRTTNQVMFVRTAFEYELKAGKIHQCWAISNRVWTW